MSLFVILGFNPRTRKGCDQLHLIFDTTVSLFQSTHPQGVRRLRVLKFYCIQFVSIHAPARGATKMFLFIWVIFKVSTTHPQGVRLTLHTPPENFKLFQLRTRKGCDVLQSFNSNWYISHPRTRRVRHPSSLQKGINLLLQSTHPQGVRLTHCKYNRDSCMFQSTHPQGATCNIKILISNFIV